MKGIFFFVKKTKMQPMCSFNIIYETQGAYFPFLLKSPRYKDFFLMFSQKYLSEYCINFYR